MRWPWGRSKTAVVNPASKDKERVEEIRDQATEVLLAAKTRREQSRSLSAHAEKVTHDQFTAQLESAIRPRRNS